MLAPDEISAILDRHVKWLCGRDGGERADLVGANLANADLAGANLASADLAGANLASAGLAGACLIHANLAYANLINANLIYANLTGAKNIDKADFGCGFCTIPPIVMYQPFYGNGLRWPVLIGDTDIKIGCEVHTIDNWESFSDIQISRMSPVALRFWRRWKEPILALAHTHAKEAARSSGKV